MTTPPWRNESIAPNGRLVCDNFRRWFGASQVIDERGEPLVVYHATDADFDAFEYSEDIGFHFGTVETANTRLVQAEMVENACIVPVYLSLQRLLELPDLYTWSPRNVVGALIRADVITPEQGDEAEFIDIVQVRDWLAAKNYDGITYNNHTEGGGRSFIALQASAIKSALGNAGVYRRHSISMTDEDPRPDLILARRARELAMAF